jgi:hypothetical protein
MDVVDACAEADDEGAGRVVLTAGGEAVRDARAMEAGVTT